MATTFKKLLRDNLWDTDCVMEFMIKHYYANESKKKQKDYRTIYSKVWQDLLNTRSQKADFKIAIDHVHDGDEEWYDVHGLSLNDQDEERWAIEMTSWRKWLGAEIDQATLAQFPASEIIAHALWEMTFFGYDSETINAKRKELMETVDRIESGEEQLFRMGEDEDGNFSFEPINKPDDDGGGGVGLS